MKNKVAIGFLGTVLDKGGYGQARWQKWRPSIGICRQPQLPLARLELLHDNHHHQLAELTARDIAEISPETEVRLHAVNLEDPWDFGEVYSALDDFAAGYAFDTEQEDYLLHITTGTHVAQICWFLLAESRRIPARLLQSSPTRQANDFAGRVSVIDLDLARYDHIASRFAQQSEDTVAFLKSGIATLNPGFNRMIEQIERVATRSSAPILLRGPTGAGKSQLARRLYELKKARRQLSGRFVEVNCATLRGDSAMSALFGHVKGAFTGALNERAGLLRSADGGLLFLDEVGELGLDEQAMLLKAIEEKRFLPFGGDREASSDFQLVCGTMRNLRQWVREGKFREDLYARINLWHFELPGLAARREDIEPNLEFELARHAGEQGRHVRFNAEARRAYLDFALSQDALWLGNFRELSASVTRMATLADAGRIDNGLVNEEIGRLREDWGGERQTDAPPCPLSSEQWEGLDLFDRAQLETVLRVCRQSASLSDAGRRLFAVSRQGKTHPNDADRLRKYLARFGLSWQTLRKEGTLPDGG
ncbi:RNA repair transcriptional activator RtcR [Chromobacterium violaceum]|uniref:Transcriptional regulatory protein rtcr n=1 Tax=Chromobacterium violaceum (strain ATCC 12472 / DSM 30191 / JCM 1249 / CCUG 213 / NBRC 12614 / NCIMB 9131 / NCTC 9757 / MK) TaxID=243365 RepID=Q7NZ86_CHRVO|nr:RNA repair transcriptional activator RtcR [Chromobacterium violaceum]AAQ58711.1 transcriptional regulatory protein rtcr [Chromobacterium violaceum ATCC 12472]SUX39717.1 Quorum-sensing regulator protein F [Chromobacterium violaceum]